MIAAIGLVLGIVAGIFLEPTVPTWLQPYLPIAVVAALDAVIGPKVIGAQHLDAAFGGTLHKMQDGGEHAPHELALRARLLVGSHAGQGKRRGEPALNRPRRDRPGPRRAARPAARRR